jgi:hypothetical protein
LGFPIIKYSNGHNVRITSPTNEAKVPIGENLLISGISAGNSNVTYINCHVSILVNGIKPCRQLVVIVGLVTIQSGHLL